MKKICFIIAAVLGLIVAVMSVAMLAGGYDLLYNGLLHKMMQIEENTKLFDMWSTIPVPLMLRVFFFNLTNPDEFLQGAQPVLDEVGPYIYREYHKKENITFHSNATVTYFQQRWWIWDEGNQYGKDPSEVITTLNAVPVSAAFVLRSNSFLLQNMNILLTKMKERPIVHATASELIFDGYQDPLLDFIQAEVVSEDGLFHWATNLFPPALLHYDKFAWFYNRNMSITFDGLYNMYTGESSLDDFGKIDWWNYSNTTKYFDFPCNEVTGSAGEIWPPKQSRTFIEFYSPDLCMTMKLYYQKDIVDSNGIDGYRYWGSNQTFTNQTYIPENKCYCIEEICAPYGVINSQSCRYGTPVFISFPHFFNADPALLTNVHGLHPNPMIHSFYIDLNPDLGAPLEVAARFQVNIQATSYKEVKMFRSVTDVLLPLFWFEAMLAMPEEMANKVSLALLMENSAIPAVFFSILLIIGIVITTIFSTILGRTYIRRRNLKRQRI